MGVPVSVCVLCVCVSVSELHGAMPFFLSLFSMVNNNLS